MDHDHGRDAAGTAQPRRAYDHCSDRPGCPQSWCVDTVCV